MDAVGTRSGCNGPWRRRRRPLAAWACGCLLAAHAAAQVLAGDPVEVATHALPGCPMPEDEPSAASAPAQAHGRVERGTSCYLSGRCRLPNSYLYDREIVPRVVLAIHAAGIYEATSIRVLGSRRWVYLQGCVASPAQRESLDALVRSIDDVEAVIDELRVVGDAPR